MWQSMGGMEVGSIWGHGSYVAPDWSADWLHREAMFILENWSHADFGADYAELNGEQQAQLHGRLVTPMRANTYKPCHQGDHTRSAAGRCLSQEFRALHRCLFQRQGRVRHSERAGIDNERLRQLSAYFFWTSWAATTNRPQETSSYTNNWPYEPLVGNRPTGETVVWTGVSIIMLLAGISAMVWWYAARRSEEEAPQLPETNPLGQRVATPSQKATVKYFRTVSALILIQMLLGVVTAHYGVGGDGFYGSPLSQWLPYSATRTWHVQMGLFWIAKAWLAAGLFIGPLVSEHEPLGQKLGVDVLFAALLLVVVGSLAEEWTSIHHKMSDIVSFYLGHPGYEYVDLGRVWQIALSVGLLLRASAHSG